MNLQLLVSSNTHQLGPGCGKKQSGPFKNRNRSQVQCSLFKVVFIPFLDF